MTPLNRREFLGTTAAAAAMAASTHVAFADETGDKKSRPVRVAVMGVNGRGRQLIADFAGFPEIEFSYICEPDSNVVAPAIKAVTERGRPEPRVVKDFRAALDDPELDVLICAAPDHWHALATILACQAGKDVYCEKPISHNLVEGRKMVEAARKYRRVVQAGMQRRSAEEYSDAIKQIRDGRLGKVHFVRTWINSTRPNIGHESPTAPPETLDFDLWAGPGSADQYRKNLVHYHWHWRWDYGTGECGNNGIHALDIARWGLDVDGPRLVTCGGDKYSFDDDQETPDTQLATFDFDGAAIQWEHRTWSPRGIDGSDFGIVFYGTEGTLSLLDDGWTIYRDNKVVEQHKGTPRSEWMRNHVRNFLDCRETREAPAADVEIAHRSTSLCHLANIAWRTRSTVRFDAKNETIVDNAPAAALLSRTYRQGYELPASA
ncbi:MAG: Gfo/Idh/MocA family oxidoreductase [Planctomycetaceae bacterium]